MILAFMEVVKVTGIAVIVIVVLTIIIAAIIAGIRAERERRAALARLASGLGLSYDPDHDRSHDDRYGHFGCFKTGHTRSAYNTMRGHVAIADLSLRLVMGDYQYSITTSNGKTTQTTTYYFSFIIAHLPWPVMPSLSVSRESFFHRIGQALGFDDIDFESAEFSRRFLVKGSDKRFVYDLIDARMMEFLMGREPPAITIDQGQLLLSSGNGRWTPSEFESQIAWMRGFFEHWPRHVVDGLNATYAG